MLPSSNYFFLITFVESNNLYPHQTEPQPEENGRALGTPPILFIRGGEPEPL